MSQEWKYDEQSGSFRSTGTSPVRPSGQYGSANRGSKRSGGIGGWVFIALMFLFGLWPIGLIALISKLKDDAPRSYSGSARAASNGSARPTEVRSSGVRRTQQVGFSQAQQQTQQPRRESRVAEAARSVTRSPSDTDSSARKLRIAGWITGVAGAIGMASEVSKWMTEGVPDLFGIYLAVGLLLGGGAMLLKGRMMRRRRTRCAHYLAILGERDSISLDELVSISGVKKRRVRRDIDYMLQRGMLDTGAFFDAGHGILFRSADAYRAFLEGRTQQEDLTPKEAQEGYSGALRAIREANDRIPDPVFSERLDRMEEIAGKIFKEVEAHPEKQKGASQFFDYYLPTTLKLLSTYTQFEEAGIEGENLRQAKERIESIMGTLLENYERQLDELYRNEAMDVDADIRVMETMLNRDLSSVERDFGLGGGAAAQKKPE